jgi:hypothetical protein
MHTDVGNSEGGRRIIQRFLKDLSHLGSVMVSVLANGPKESGFEASRGDAFLRAIKMHSMPSLGGEVKSKAHVVGFYGMLRK